MTVSLPRDPSPAREPDDPNLRRAGILLLLTVGATVVSVIARVASGADQGTVAATLTGIAEEAVLYGLGGGARLAAGVSLLLAARHLAGTRIIREGFGSAWVPRLLGVSGAATALSGALALVLAAAAPEPGAGAEALAAVRRLTGVAGFGVAGLARLVAARYQWLAGGLLRRVAVGSFGIGASMQFMWVPEATVVHRFSGVAFVLWLLLMGVMLLTGRVEREFAARRRQKPSTASG